MTTTPHSHAFFSSAARALARTEPVRPKLELAPPLGAPPPFIRLRRDPAFLLLALLVGILHFSLLTRFTGKVDVPEIKNSSYDSLAESLLEGRATVDAADIGDEQMSTTDGETCMYFGPFPALLRFVNLGFESMRGRWARLSCLLAAFLALAGYAKAAQLMLEGNRALSSGEKRRRFLVTWVGLGFGSIFVFLLSWGAIYHEAILWGLAFGAWGIYLAFRPPSVGTLTLASAAAAGALLSRITFGLSSLAIFAAMLVRDRRLVLEGGLPQRVVRIATILLPVGAGLLFQAWYNYARFGSPLTFLDFSTWQFDPQGFGGSLHAGRIPAALYNYFWIRSEYFQWSAPFVVMPKVVFFDPSLHFAHYREWNISLLVVSPWLLYGAARGLVPLVKKGWFPLVCLAAYAGQALLIAANFFITHRYSADLLPLLVLPYLFFLGNAKPERRWAARAALPALCLLGVLTTNLSTLHWISMRENWGIGEETKAKVRRILVAVDEAVGRTEMAHRRGDSRRRG